jgi:hypothetical protein
VPRFLKGDTEGDWAAQLLCQEVGLAHERVSYHQLLAQAGHAPAPRLFLPHICNRYKIFLVRIWISHIFKNILKSESEDSKCQIFLSKDEVLPILGF